MSTIKVMSLALPAVAFEYDGSYEAGIPLQKFITDNGFSIQSFHSNSLTQAIGGVGSESQEVKPLTYVLHVSYAPPQTEGQVVYSKNTTVHKGYLVIEENGTLLRSYTAEEFSQKYTID